MAMLQDDMGKKQSITLRSHSPKISKYDVRM